MQNYIIANPTSTLFVNQVIEGRAQENYPKKEPEIPRRYHNKVKMMVKEHLYPGLFPAKGESSKAKKTVKVSDIKASEDAATAETTKATKSTK